MAQAQEQLGLVGRKSDPAAEAATIRPGGEGAELISGAASSLSARQDAFWWQGALMRIKARAEDTGGALGLVEANFYQGFGPPLHVHSREDEGILMLEGEIRFRQGDDEFVAGPGTLVWGPRGVPHAFKVESEGARARDRHAGRLRADVRAGRRAGRRVSRATPARVRPRGRDRDLEEVRVRGRRTAARVADRRCVLPPLRAKTGRLGRRSRTVENAPHP
jgi:quercetin dioxygenase-like cupin family protein